MTAPVASGEKVSSLDFVPFLRTPKGLLVAKAAYEGALVPAGRAFRLLDSVYVPREGWPYNAGGEGNQQDDPLRHFLAWWFYGDEKALQSAFNILDYLAGHMTSGEHKYQNGHGQRHPNFGLAALLAQERGDLALAERMAEAEVKLYSLNLGSKEWSSIGPTTFRPGCRFVSTTARLVHDAPLLQKAGLIHPEQFPGDVAPEAVLARLVKWVERWFWKMQLASGGEGWTVTPGLYRYDPDERDWLYWSMSTSGSEEDNVTAFMHYSIFTRDLAVALTWLEGLIDEPTRDLWTRRLRDMATWALAVAYNPESGRARRAKDWSPEILAQMGPLRLYDSDEWGERTHSVAAPIAAARAPREKRRKELVNALGKGMKLAPGEVDEGLVIAAVRLGMAA